MTFLFDVCTCDSDALSIFDRTKLAILNLPARQLVIEHEQMIFLLLQTLAILFEVVHHILNILVGIALV